MAGTLAGFGGAFIIAVTSVVLLPFCGKDTSFRGRAFRSKTGLEGGSTWTWKEKALLLLAITVWGGLGSVLDSALGGWFQASVIDSRTGKVFEGTGGKKVIPICYGSFQLLIESIQVLISGSRTPENKKSDKPTRHVESGLGILDNNAVNLLMAVLMSLGGMVFASWLWHIPLRTLWS